MLIDKIKEKWVEVFFSYIAVIAFTVFPNFSIWGIITITLLYVAVLILLWVLDLFLTPRINQRLLLRNCLKPEIGKHILDCAFKTNQTKLNL